MSTIACVKSIHPKTYLSGGQFKEGGSYRIFYQTPEGAICATTTDNFGADWRGGSSFELVPKGRAKLETPMASVFFKSNDISGSRTFYIGANNEIRAFGVQSYIFDGRINAGQFIAAPYSRIGAVAWTFSDDPNISQSVDIRVYYQSADDHIQEITFNSTNNGKYFLSKTFPNPLKGTSLAFNVQTFPKPGTFADVVIRGYYQHSDLRIMEIVWNKSWQAGTFINGNCIVESGTHITASSDQNKAGQVCVYWTNSCAGYHSVTECIRNGDGNWQLPQLITICCAESSPRLLAICHIPANSTQTCVRLFFVGMNGLLNDARRENGHWGWGGKSGGPCKWLPC